MRATFDLHGRVALVTGVGGPRGIGYAVARTLSDLGAALVVTASSARVHERAAELPEGTLAMVGDLTDEATGAALVAAATTAHGRLDAVVNCAGMTSVSATAPESGRVETMELATWRAALARNLDAAFLLARATIPVLAAGDAGRLVMVSSLTGPVMAMRGEVGYAAAKAGLVGLVRALAVDAAGSGVTVNAVAPGWIATDSQTVAERAEGRRTPLGRSGTPEEVAGLVGYLCTPSAAYVTGQCLVVDGGNSVAEERACDHAP